jgi:hypothetical protein
VVVQVEIVRMRKFCLLVGKFFWIGDYMRDLILAGVISLGLTNIAVAKSPDADIAKYLSISPDDVRYPERCATETAPVVYGDSVIAAELDGRFHYVKRQGRDNGMLIEFDDRCEGLQMGPGTNAPLTNRCVDSRVRFDFHQTCRVENLYSVPNAISARALALRIQTDRARESGLSLPSDPILAAEAYVAARNASGEK